MDAKLSCIDCAVKNCDKMDKTFPEFCLTTNMDTEVLNEAMELYKDEENHKVTVAAATVETDYYCQMTRVEEIAEFAKRMGYKKIGIATCVGLLAERQQRFSVIKVLKCLELHVKQERSQKQTVEFQKSVRRLVRICATRFYRQNC